MKKFFALCLLAVMSFGVASVCAQPQQQQSNHGPEKVIIETTKFIVEMDGKETEKRIMDVIGKEKGVKEVKIDAPKKMVIVSYEKSKNSDAALIKSFANIRVKAHVAK